MQACLSSPSKPVIALGGPNRDLVCLTWQWCAHLAANDKVVVDITDAGNGGAVTAGVNIDAEEDHSHKDDGAVQVAGSEHCLSQH